MGHEYLIPSIEYTPNEKMVLSLFDFWNTNDASQVFGGAIDYFYNDYVELIFMPYYIIGHDLSEFGMQKDLIGQCAAEVKVRIAF